MKIFEIGFKLFYGETSDWGTETIKAKNKQKALMNFAKMKSVEGGSLSHHSDWRWSEGIWSASFRYVKEVKIVTCPHCNGSGAISVNEGIDNRL